MTLQHLRSSTANKRPDPTAMADGQIALNTAAASPGLFYKDSAGNLVKVGPVHVGATAPNASPASGGTAGNSVGEQWLDTTGGTYVFKVWDGSAWRSETGTFVDVNGDVMTGALGIIAGSAGSPGLYFSGDTNTGLYSPGADQLALSTNGAERLRVNSGGLLGVATSNPQTLVSLLGGYQIGWNHATDGTKYAEIYADTSSNLIFRNTNSQVERMRLDSSGRLGVGTSSPSYQLDCVGGSGLRVQRSSGATIAFFENTGAVSPNIAFAGSTTTSTPYIGVTANDLILGTNGADRIRLDSSGRLGIGTSTPAVALDVIGGGRFSSNTTAGNLVQFRNTDGTSLGYVGVEGPTGGVQLPGTLANAAFIASGAGGSALQFGSAGSIRATLDSSGRLGIGTTPDSVLHVDKPGVARLRIGYLDTSLNYYDADTQIFRAGNTTERARIDSSGRLLVGTSSASSTATTLLLQGSADGASGPSYLRLATGTSSPGSTSTIGQISFTDSGHTTAASIIALRDGGTWTSGSSQPTRLTFSTTSDQASSPTERVRITSGGFFKAQGDSSYIGSASNYHEFVSNQSNTVTLIAANQNSSFASAVSSGGCARAANSAYSFQYWYSAYPNSPDLEFNLRGDGNAYADGTWSGGGADYAEYFEWSDSNPDAEDRRGISVVLDGDKIREAVAGEDPIGVISGNPSVIGDAAWNKWSGKHLRDEYGTYILDENGDRQLNPDYDPDQKYISREQRPEWDCVGLMGKLRIRKGQVTGSRWIKMRDISDSVEEWLVR